MTNSSMVSHVPVGWRSSILGDEVEFLDGKRRPVKDQDRQKMRGTIPYYGASGVVDYVDNFLFDEELVLLGEDGENILSRNLPLAFRIEGKSWVNNHAHVMRVNENVDAIFLTALLESLNFEKYNSGTAQPKLNKQTCFSIPLTVPPLAEQKRIATALKDIDDLIASLDALIAKKRDIKQAAMQQLLTGKTRLSGFEGEWQVYSFATLFTFLKNGSNSRSDLSPEGEVAYVHYGDIHACASSRMSAITLPKIAASRVSGLPRVQNGDLIFADASEDYAGVGKSVEMVDCDDREVVAGLHTILARGNDNLLADGFKGYIQMLPDVKAALIRIANGISVYGISKTGIRPIQILLPGKDEQAAIAAVLVDMDAEIDELAAKRSKAVAIRDGMMQQLLTGRIRLV